MRKRKEYYEYPLRTCYWLNHCAVCNHPITSGQKYYDGGYGRRCHFDCAPPNKPVESDRAIECESGSIPGDEETFNNGQGWA